MRLYLHCLRLYNNQVRDAIGSRIEDGPQEIDVLSWTTRTALELIGQSGLGTGRVNKSFCSHCSYSFVRLQF